mmetsp:Transcript_29877/g.86832  ORF Transcript_29877/g.86832 Transcript_29877/m.86832 type:complete len:261 (-) Transcript_29877:84-866(-)
MHFRFATHVRQAPRCCHADLRVLGLQKVRDSFGRRFGCRGTACHATEGFTSGCGNTGGRILQLLQCLCFILCANPAHGSERQDCRHPQIGVFVLQTFRKERRGTRAFRAGSGERRSRGASPLSQGRRLGSRYACDDQGPAADILIMQLEGGLERRYLRSHSRFSEGRESKSSGRRSAGVLARDVATELPGLARSFGAHFTQGIHGRLPHTRTLVANELGDLRGMRFRLTRSLQRLEARDPHRWVRIREVLREFRMFDNRH